jgi:hypothetical protein
METINRLDYDRPEVTDAEVDVSFLVKQTLTQGCNDGATLKFRFPADPDRYTDLNSTLLRLTVGVYLPDGTQPNYEHAGGGDGEEEEEEEEVVHHQETWLDPEGMHSLFSHVEVLFNDEVVSTMTMYPFTTSLVRHLGMVAPMRTEAWDELDGTHNHQELKTDYLGANIGIEEQSWAAQIRHDKTLYGRIFSDILTSSRQYLPPGVTLGINLRRAPDRFSLVTNAAAHDYKLRISAASVYIKRLQLRPSLYPRGLPGTGGRHLTFNRLECRMMAIPQG